MDPRLGVQGGESWCRMVFCFSSKCGQLECSLDVDLDKRLDQPMVGRQYSKLESMVRGEEEEQMGVDSLEMGLGLMGLELKELGLMGVAASVLLGWKSFHLDHLFVVGLVLKPDLEQQESVKFNLGLSGLVQPIFWRTAVSWVVKILAALGHCSDG